MKRILLALCVLLSCVGACVTPSRAADPGNFAARVTGPGGEAVAGATVLLPELGRRAVSGADGAFTFAGLAAGTYQVMVRCAGYEPLAAQVSVPPADGFTLALRRTTALELEPVYVTGTRSAGEAGGSPLPAASLGGDALRANHTVSIAHAIQALPGVRVLSTGGEIGKPVIRGLYGARVLVLDDGNRLEDYSWSDEDGPSIEARQAERVEVIRGAASVLYGSDAMGGVVNAISEDLPEARGREGFVRAGAESYFASGTNEFGGALRVEGAKEGLGWRLFGVGRSSESIHTPLGELENTGFDAINGEAAVGLHGERSTTTLRVARYGGNFKLLEANGPPPGSPPPAAEEEGPKRAMNDVRVQLHHEQLLSGGLRFEGRAQWQRHSLAEISQDFLDAVPGLNPDTLPASVDTTKAFDLVLNTLSAEALLHHGGSGLHGTVGVSGTHQTSNSDGGVVPIVPNASVSSGAGFAFEQLQAGRWGLLAGARLDVRHLAADPSAWLGLASQTRDYTDFSGDLGAVYTLDENLSLAGNVSRSFRAPTLFELFSNGPQLGEARFIVGDATLKSEHGVGLDASLRVKSSAFRGELSVYTTRIHDFVYLSPTTEFRDTLRVYRYRQTTARLSGVEAGARVEATPHLSLGGQFDLTRGDDTDAGEPLPLIPPARVRGEVELHTASLGWAEEAHVGVEVEATLSKTHLAPEDVRPEGTDAYTLVNLDAGVRRAFGGRSVRLDLRVQNLGNVEYRGFLSRYKEFAPDQGRSIVVRLSSGL